MYVTPNHHSAHAAMHMQNITKGRYTKKRIGKLNATLDSHLFQERSDVASFVNVHFTKAIKVGTLHYDISAYWCISFDLTCTMICQTHRMKQTSNRHIRTSVWH